MWANISLCEGAVAKDGDGLKNCCNTFPVEATGRRGRRGRRRRRLRGKWWGSWGSGSHVSVARICLSTVSLLQIVGRPVTASISRLSVTTILFPVRVYLCVVLSSLSPPTLWIFLSKSLPFIFCRPDLVLGHERDLFWSLCFWSSTTFLLLFLLGKYLLGRRFSVSLSDRSMHGKSCPFSAHKFSVIFLLCILFHA